MKQYTRDEIFDVVRKHLTEIVDTIKPDQVTNEASMKELGANSLDMVEIVSCSMREIKVRVPRKELAGLTDIGGLVDLLHQVQESSLKQTA
jgi:acyl carrier protein